MRSWIDMNLWWTRKSENDDEDPKPKPHNFTNKLKRRAVMK